MAFQVAWLASALASRARRISGPSASVTRTAVDGSIAAMALAAALASDALAHGGVAFRQRAPVALFGVVANEDRLTEGDALDRRVGAFELSGGFGAEPVDFAVETILSARLCVPHRSCGLGCRSFRLGLRGRQKAVLAEGSVVGW